MLFIKILIAIIAVLHLGIMYLEMFSAPEKQAESFGMPLKFVQQENAQIALKNMGIYNGSLGLLILASLALVPASALVMVLSLEMIFIIIVGIYGGATVTKRIYFIQAVPAAVALVALYFFS